MVKPQFKPAEEQYAYLMKGVADMVPEPPSPGQSVFLGSMVPLIVMLRNSVTTGTPLRVKLGVDPTTPDIHLGHTVVIRKLKHFQDMGHTAIFLVGDFTALVGDPTGQSETRPPLSREQVKANAKTYLDQVFKILDPRRTEVRYNSEWLDKLGSYDIVRLCGKFRLARMLEHEDFRSRLRNNQPISVHELLYPLFQAYDSVALEADVELGATEQKFNLLMGRDIQREYYAERGITSERGVSKSPQVALMMPILVGLDGQRKMSKSLGNYIGITEPPSEMFGKMMSIPDDLMWSYYELLTDRTPDEIVSLKKEVSSGTLHPMAAKMRLAEEVIADFHSQEAARKAADSFQRHRDRQPPSEVRVQKLKCGPPTRLWTIVRISDLAPSRSEAERLIKQKAVEIDGVVIDDPRKEIDVTKPTTFLLRVGKKDFVRFVVELPPGP